MQIKANRKGFPAKCGILHKIFNKKNQKAKRNIEEAAPCQKKSPKPTPCGPWIN